MKKECENRFTGTLNVCALVFPGANVESSPTPDETPLRIKKELAYANTIWKKKINGITQGVQFQLVKTIIFEQRINGLDVNAEKIVMKQRKLDKNAKLLVGLAKKFCPDADIYLYYLDGDRIGAVGNDGARVLAITYIDYPLIIMSNGAMTSDFILAHELGHFLFNNNRYGKTADPDPVFGDLAHNASPNNLMYPTGMHWPKPPQMPTIMPEQIQKALENKYLR